MQSRKELIEKIVRLYTYLRHGHGSVLSFIISLINTVIIQYTLLISKIPFLKNIFSNILIFAGIFLLIYVPVCIFLGRLDMKKGSFRKTVEISAELNPMMRKLIEIEERLRRIEERIDKIEKILSSQC